MLTDIPTNSKFIDLENGVKQGMVKKSLIVVVHNF